MVLTASGHILVECRIRVQLPSFNSLILHSTIYFVSESPHRSTLSNVRRFEIPP